MDKYVFTKVVIMRSQTKTTNPPGKRQGWRGTSYVNCFPYMSLGGAKQTQLTNQGTDVGGKELVIQTTANPKARPRVGIIIALNNNAYCLCSLVYSLRS
jgi:hypothetical protein